MKVFRVRALDLVSNNGKEYVAGAEFDMEVSLVPAHTRAGLVEVTGNSRDLADGEAPHEDQAIGGPNEYTPPAEPEPAEPEPPTDSQPEPAAGQE